MSAHTRSSVLSEWQFQSEDSCVANVLPDGCRDLILRVVGKEKPEWFVSPLFDSLEQVAVEGGATLMGFRMRPGVEISEELLFNHLEAIDVENRYIEDSDIRDVSVLLDELAYIDHSVEEALSCMASNVRSVREGANRLGVSMKTLQRLILRKTHRPPSYWFQLARARKAARDMTISSSLADVAEKFGFSDQSHMHREFQRWFRSTPLEISNSPDLIEQLMD